MLPQTHREDLRFAVREQLVIAKTVALTAEMIKRRVERARMLDFEFAVGDVEDALAVVVGLSHAREEPSPYGATKYFQATAVGVLAHERNQ